MTEQPVFRFRTPEGDTFAVEVLPGGGSSIRILDEFDRVVKPPVETTRDILHVMRMLDPFLFDDETLREGAARLLVDLERAETELRALRTLAAERYDDLSHVDLGEVAVTGVKVLGSVAVAALGALVLPAGPVLATSSIVFGLNALADAREDEQLKVLWGAVLDYVDAALGEVPRDPDLVESFADLPSLPELVALTRTLADEAGPTYGEVEAFTKGYVTASSYLGSSASLVASLAALDDTVNFDSYSLLSVLALIDIAKKTAVASSLSVAWDLRDLVLLSSYGADVLEQRTQDLDRFADTLADFSQSGLFSDELQGTLREEAEALVLYGRDAGTTYILGSDTDDRVETFGADDRVDAGGGEDVIRLTGGSDIVDAGPGNDVILVDLVPGAIVKLDGGGGMIARSLPRTVAVMRMSTIRSAMQLALWSPACRASRRYRLSISRRFRISGFIP